MNGPSDANGRPATPEENAVIVRRFYERMNAHDAVLAARFFAEDVVHHNPLPGSPPGREGNEGTMRALFAGFPNWGVEVESAVAQGDRVAVRTTQRGSHEGEFFGIAPTDRQVEFSAMAVYRLEGGLIVEEWIEADRLGLLAQLGVIDLPWTSSGAAPR
jgi:steroid delta-isomerase-like uncharacterized protein